MKPYEDGYELKEDEYLLKIVKNSWQDGSDKGFLAKHTQKGKIPEAFKNWPVRRYAGNSPADWDHPVYVHKETFGSGWRIMSWRFGQSQNWASLVHPKGFTVEIYLTQLLEIMKTHTVIEGVLQGEFKWQDHKLICKARLS
jgi:hypothetical protein